MLTYAGDAEVRLRMQGFCEAFVRAALERKRDAAWTLTLHALEFHLSSPTGQPQYSLNRDLIEPSQSLQRALIEP